MINEVTKHDMREATEFPTREVTSQVIKLGPDSAAFLVEVLTQVAAKGPQAAILADLYAQAKTALDQLSKKNG